MGQKDISEKMLEAYSDVFADIINVLLFQGTQVIKPEELVDCPGRSAYKADGEVREQERDVAKHWKKNNIRIACFGIENQSESDMAMPVRVLSYDAAEYRMQLNRENQGRFYPVVTLVLYFNAKKDWSGSRSLLEQIKIPEEFCPYVNDYRINLFDIAGLDRKQVELFRSDFRAVADYFVQMRKTGEYTGSNIELKHVQEVLHFLSVMTGDHRYEAVFSAENKGEEGVKTMCEALDRIEKRGIARGRAEGKAEGKAEGIAENEALNNQLFSCLLANGLTEEALKATQDHTYKLKLMKKYQIALP